MQFPRSRTSKPGSSNARVTTQNCSSIATTHMSTGTDYLYLHETIATKQVYA